MDNPLQPPSSNPRMLPIRPLGDRQTNKPSQEHDGLGSEAPTNSKSSAACPCQAGRFGVRLYGWCLWAHTYMHARLLARKTDACIVYEWKNGKLNQRVSGWVSACMSMSEWLDDWMTEWLNDWMNESMNQWINESMNQWMESVPQWISESVNQWVIKWVSSNT
jgi:hypothetical protein